MDGLVLMLIKLNADEYSYLCQATFLPSHIRKALLLAKKEISDFILEISEDHADETRDLCQNQLQLFGFDAQYELTKEGQILENLIDKLFIE